MFGLFVNNKDGILQLGAINSVYQIESSGTLQSYTTYPGFANIPENWIKSDKLLLIKPANYSSSFGLGMYFNNSPYFLYSSGGEVYEYVLLAPAKVLNLQRKTYGLQIFDAEGNLTFASSENIFKPTVIAEFGMYSPDVTIPIPDKNKPNYAVLQASWVNYAPSTGLVPLLRLKFNSNTSCTILRLLPGTLSYKRTFMAGTL